MIELRIQPGARRVGIVGMYGDLPKLAVNAPPVDGAANAAAIAALAELLGVRPRQVTLVSGQTSRTKRFAIDGVNDADIRARLIKKS